MALVKEKTVYHYVYLYIINKNEDFVYFQGTFYILNITNQVNNKLLFVILQNLTSNNEVFLIRKCR